MKDTVKVTKNGNTLQVDIKEGNQERWLSLSLEQGIELMWNLEKELEGDVNISNKVGNKITNIRCELGVNQKEFARLTDSTVSAVSNWENNRNKPNKERLKIIAELGNTSVKDLLEGEDLDAKEN